MNETSDVSEIPQYLVRGGRAGEEHQVAQPVEGGPKRGEPLGGAPVDLRDAVAPRQVVLGGELVALASQLVVVGEVRPSLSGPAGLDEVREQPREPQAVVAQVRPQEEGPL